MAAVRLVQLVLENTLVGISHARGKQFLYDDYRK